MSFVAIALDIDSRIGLEKLAAASMSASDTAPTPNLTIFRKSSGHAHAIYTLRRPVLRGPNARPFPLSVLARCSEWLLTALSADAGYTGVLVSNPIHDDYDTRWLRTRGYALSELRAYIPHGWRRPKPPRTDAGRNDAIFQAVIHYAGYAKHSDEDVALYAEHLHAHIDVQHPHSFTTTELRGIVSSVLRRRARWRQNGWHDPDWIALQSLRGARNTPSQQALKGIRSGERRRERTQDRDQRILERLTSGWGVRQVARAEGVRLWTVQVVRDRARGDQ